jgi:hypothetical protein
MAKDGVHSLQPGTTQMGTLVQAPEDYVFSSAAFYATKDMRWPFLTHFWYGDDWLTANE